MDGIDMLIQKLGLDQRFAIRFENLHSGEPVVDGLPATDGKLVPGPAQAAAMGARVAKDEMTTDDQGGEGAAPQSIEQKRCGRCKPGRPCPKHRKRKGSPAPAGNRPISQA